MNSAPIVKRTFWRSRDGLAVTLSSLCIAHCLGTYLLILLIPAAAAGLQAEWIHKLLVCLAAITTASVVVFNMPMTTRLVFVVLAAAGLVFLFGAAFSERPWVSEEFSTVLGGTLLVLAHSFRWRQQCRGQKEVEVL